MKPDYHWYRETYPKWHATFIRAASQLIGADSQLAGCIKSALNRSQGEIRLPAKDTIRGDIKRAQAYVEYLAADDRHTWILRELHELLNRTPVRQNLNVVSLIEATSDRWNRYGKKETFDCVSFLPEFEAVARISASEVEGDLGSVSSPIAPFALQNIHYYPSFNWLKPVKGRRVQIQALSSKEDLRGHVGELKPLLRTLWHGRLAGLGGALDQFVLVGSPTLELWTFHASIGRFTNIRDDPAPIAGFHEPILQLEDTHLDQEVLFPPQVLARTLQDPLMDQMGTQIKYIQDLVEWEGKSLVVLGWPLAQDEARVVSWWPLGESPNLDLYEILARVISTRKVAASELDQEYSEWQGLLARQDIAEWGDWLYYVPNVDKKLFRDWLAGGCMPLQPSDAVTCGVREVREFNRRLTDLFSISPGLQRLYLSNDPERTYRKIHRDIAVREREK